MFRSSQITYHKYYGQSKSQEDLNHQQLVPTTTKSTKRSLLKTIARRTMQIVFLATSILGAVGGIHALHQLFTSNEDDDQCISLCRMLKKSL